MAELKNLFDSPISMIIHSLQTPPFWFMLGGVIVAWMLCLYRVKWANFLQRKFKAIHYMLDSLYGFDRFNQIVFVDGIKKISNILWKVSDMSLIDKIIVNGAARLTGLTGSIMRNIQTGYIYHYAFFMICSLLIILAWVVIKT
jgi:NADH-quinone oxidoreductase subunit L